MRCIFARARSIKYQNGYASENSNANNGTLRMELSEKRNREKKKTENLNKRHMSSILS